MCQDNWCIKHTVRVYGNKLICICLSYIVLLSMYLKKIIVWVANLLIIFSLNPPWPLLWPQQSHPSLLKPLIWPVPWSSLALLLVTEPLLGFIIDLTSLRLFRSFTTPTSKILHLFFLSTLVSWTKSYFHYMGSSPKWVISLDIFCYFVILPCVVLFRRIPLMRKHVGFWMDAECMHIVPKMTSFRKLERNVLPNCQSRT